jgi:hypothetical protein
MMRVFRNKSFTKRDYEATNVVACTIVDDGAKVPDNFELTEDSLLWGEDEAALAGLTPLWIEGGIRYWGWL